MTVKTLFLPILVSLSMSMCTFPSWALGKDTHLVLIGGGTSPERSIKNFMTWAGDKEARILFVAWGTSQPQSAFESMGSRFYPYSPKTFELAISSSDFSSELLEQLSYDELRKKIVDEICERLNTPDGKKKILSQINNATGIFFSGGDQDFIMDVLEKNPHLKDLLQKRFNEGVVFGGTSAGTAIMSSTMVTQRTESSYDDYYTRVGLGLLPAHVIVDQHFFQRPKRIERLTDALNKGSETIGVGVDEDNAVTVTDGKTLEVVGEGKVWLKDKLASPKIRILKGRDGWNLSTHQPINTIPHQPKAKKSKVRDQEIPK